jgi:Na+/melibiose symporter-like transporter
MAGPTTELIPCPGCTRPLHHRAVLCPHCGYSAEITTYQEQLASLSTICSILTGFGLTSLVALAVDASKFAEGWLFGLIAGIWLVSSLLLLLVLILAELLRRQEVSETVLHLSHPDREQFARRCERLLTIFALALAGTAVGLLLLGFQFSLLHGLCTLAGLGLAVVVTWWVMR